MRLPSSKTVTEFTRTVMRNILGQSGLEPALFGSRLKIHDCIYGTVNFSLEIHKDNLNRLKTLHGGAIASVVDLGGSLAVASTGRFVTGVSTDINVTFLRSGGNEGDTVSGQAICDKIGPSLAYTTIALRNGKGDLVARGSHTKYIGGTNQDRLWHIPPPWNTDPEPADATPTEPGLQSSQHPDAHHPVEPLPRETTRPLDAALGPSTSTLGLHHRPRALGGAAAGLGTPGHIQKRGMSNRSSTAENTFSEHGSYEGAPKKKGGRKPPARRRPMWDTFQDQGADAHTERPVAARLKPVQPVDTSAAIPQEKRAQPFPVHVGKEDGGDDTKENLKDGADDATNGEEVVGEENAKQYVKEGMKDATKDGTRHDTTANPHASVPASNDLLKASKHAPETTSTTAETQDAQAVPVKDSSEQPGLPGRDTSAQTVPRSRRPNIRPRLYMSSNMSEREKLESLGFGHTAKSSILKDLFAATNASWTLASETPDADSSRTSILEALTSIAREPELGRESISQPRYKDTAPPQPQLSTGSSPSQDDMHATRHSTKDRHLGSVSARAAQEFDQPLYRDIVFRVMQHHVVSKMMSKQINIQEDVLRLKVQMHKLAARFEAQEACLAELKHAIGRLSDDLHHKTRQPRVSTTTFPGFGATPISGSRDRVNRAAPITEGFKDMLKRKLAEGFDAETEEEAEAKEDDSPAPDTDPDKDA